MADRLWSVAYWVITAVTGLLVAAIVAEWVIAFGEGDLYAQIVVLLGFITVWLAAFCMRSALRERGGLLVGPWEDR